LLHLVEDIRLVASEFATIAMVYTRAPFTLRLERMNDLIRLTVVEGSPPLPVRASANIIDSSRQSMSVVEVVSQSWGMDPNPSVPEPCGPASRSDPGSSNPCRQRGALRPKPVIERSRVIEPAAG